MTKKTNKQTKTHSGGCPYQGSGGGEDCFDGGGAGAAAAGGVDPLLLLSPVAEPHADHLLLHVELIGYHGNLLRGRFLVLLEEDKTHRAQTPFQYAGTESERKLHCGLGWN